MFDLLEPVELDFDFNAAQDFGIIGGYIDVHDINHQPDLDRADIFIVGVPEARNAINNEGLKHGPQAIRKAFYQLFPGGWSVKIADLGNLKLTTSAEQTYTNLTELLYRLPVDASLIILGGSQDLTNALTNYYDLNNKAYNLSVIDAFIDSSLTDSDIDNENYLTGILNNSNSQLQNLNLFGIQTYYNHPSKYQFFDQLYLDYFKLGAIKNYLSDIEPEIRDSEIVSLDIRSVQNAAMPAHIQGQPNGFTGIEICKIARMAGIATKNHIFGLFEYNPLLDQRYTGANLAAQILWYYIEGKNSFQPDYPAIPKSMLLKFYVENEILKLIFYKNPKTNRWWVQLPQMTDQALMFSCSEIDYQEAVKMKITKRIHRIINKITI